MVKVIQHIFFQKSRLNFCVQSYASLSHEYPAYLQITYHYVYNLRYTELKRFFGHRVWVPEPAYRLLNSSGYVYAHEIQMMNF